MGHGPWKLVSAVGVVLLTAGLAGAAPKAGHGPGGSPEMVAKGKALYGTFCVVCHGEKGDGNGPAGVALNPKPRNFSTDPFKQGSRPPDIFATLGTGVPGTPMVAFAQLTEEDRWALAHYVHTFVPPPKGKKK